MALLGIQTKRYSIMQIQLKGTLSNVAHVKSCNETRDVHRTQKRC